VTGHLSTYVGLLHRTEQTLADSLHAVGEGHAQEADVLYLCRTLARMSEEHVRLLAPIAERYGEEQEGDGVDEPDRLHAAGVGETRSGAVGLLRDLQDLHLLASLASTTWTAVGQGAKGLRDRELIDVCGRASATNARQLTALLTRMKTAAPQALLVAS
jgi:hypothetical protein